MTRKRTRRKHYDLIDTVTMAIEGAAITDTKALDKIRLSELSALESFRTGAATKHDWRVLADCVNVQESMCDMGIGPEALPACLAAQEALGACQDRSKKHDGRLVFTGPELQAMREAYEYADVQRASISRNKFEQAIKKTADRIRSCAANVKVYV